MWVSYTHCTKYINIIIYIPLAYETNNNNNNNMLDLHNTYVVCSFSTRQVEA